MSLVLDYGNNGNGGAPSSSPPTSEILYAQDPSPQGSQDILLAPTPRDILYHHEPENSDLGGSPGLFESSDADLFPSVPLGSSLPTAHQGCLSCPPEGHKLVTSSGISSGSSGRATRRRRRSPPSASKFDINDNSLTSVYTFIRSFLRFVMTLRSLVEHFPPFRN